MESHGNNPQENVIAIIPARYASTRLPGKLLLPIAGKPLILHTVEQAAKAVTVARVIVATDDIRIFSAVREAQVEAVMTSTDHVSGSDRLAEASAELPADLIIVNVQGDEPMISPSAIDAAVTALIDEKGVDVATTCEPIDNVDDVLDPNVVKVVAGPDGMARYFSRSPIPYLREAANSAGGLAAALEKDPKLISHFRKHTGLYVYRREFLLRFTKMTPTRLERLEMLEQLRALENGAKIKVVETSERSIGVDTMADLELVRSIIEQRQ